MTDTVTVDQAATIVYAWRRNPGPSVQITTPNGLHLPTGRCTLHVAVDPPTTTVDVYIDAERQPRTTRKGCGIARLDLTDCSIPEPGHSHLLRADAGTNEARMVVTDRLLRGIAPP